MAWKEERAVVEALQARRLPARQSPAKLRRPAHVLRRRWFHRLGGGTFRTAPFRTPGNIRWPAPLDDLSNSLLATFFHSPLLSRRLLIAQFPKARLNLDHQPQIVVILHSPVIHAMRVIVNSLPHLYRI